MPRHGLLIIRLREKTCEHRRYQKSQSCEMNMNTLKLRVYWVACGTCWCAAGFTPLKALFHCSYSTWNRIKTNVKNENRFNSGNGKRKFHLCLPVSRTPCCLTPRGQESSAKTFRKPLQQHSALTSNWTIMFVLSKHTPSFIPEVI